MMFLQEHEDEAAKAMLNLTFEFYHMSLDVSNIVPHRTQRKLAEYERTTKQPPASALSHGRTNLCSFNSTTILDLERRHITTGSTDVDGS